MSRRRVATAGSGLTFVMAGVAGAAGGQLAGKPWAWICLGTALLVGGVATAWTTWRITDDPTPPAPGDSGNPPEPPAPGDPGVPLDQTGIGAGGVFAGRDMTILGEVSTSTRSDAPAGPTPARGKETGAAHATVDGQANTGPQGPDDGRPGQVIRSGDATAYGPGSRANTGIQRKHPSPSPNDDPPITETDDCSGTPPRDSGGGEPSRVWVRASMTSTVELAEMVPVTVLLAGKPLWQKSGPGEASGSAVAESHSPLVIELVLRANFEAAGITQQTVDVPGVDNIHPIAFAVRPTHIGQGEIWVVVRQHGLPLLEPLVLTPAIVSRPDLLGAAPAPPRSGPTGSGQASPTSTSPPQDEPTTGSLDTQSPPPSAPEVLAESQFSPLGEAPRDAPPQVLRIHEQHHGNIIIFRYELEAHDLQLMAAFTSQPLIGDRLAYVQALFRKVETTWRSTHRDHQMFAERLRSLGADLLDELIPPELQRILWDNRHRLRDVLVLSTEPFIPWELLHLKDPDVRRLPDETCFLGQLGLLRWTWGPYPPAQIQLRPGRARHIIPTYPPPLNLPRTLHERDFLENALGSIEVTPNYWDALALLKSGSFDLLHFAGHGCASGDDIADAHILLAGRHDNHLYVEEPLEVSVIRQNFYRSPRTSGSGEDSRDYRPLVILNACQTGRRGYELSSIGGFAEAFVHGGAGAFVGCMWSVGDQPAFTFVEEFYRCLLAGKTVAAATSAAREAARQAGDATWLAYTVYAHPNAVLVQQRAQELTRATSKATQSAPDTLST